MSDIDSYDMNQLPALLARIRACRLCAPAIDPRPVLRASATARLLIVGQAPGTRVHETGIPWNDASGRRLRDWLGLTPEIFYDESRIAIAPIGFCFPGQDAKGGDLPPRRECAATWQRPLRALLPRVEMTLLVGSHAQAFWLTDRGRTMTETVAAWREYRPQFWPLPHPSWRNTGWLKRHDWFGRELIPELRKAVQDIVK